MISLYINSRPVHLSFNQFSDTAEGCKIVGAVPVNPTVALIYCLRDSDEDTIGNSLFNIAQLVDILRKMNPRIRINLFMPYLPYARQDRNMVSRDSFGMRVFANMLNSLMLDGVMVFDAHSDVGPALINNCINIPQDKIAEYILPGGYDGLVVPDAGAYKKTSALSKTLQIPLVHMGKVRDVNTGAITETVLLSDSVMVAGKRLVLVDDICDGGRTFIEAARVLKAAGAGDLTLCVTHGIFANGLGGIHHKDVFSQIVTTDSIFFQKWDAEEPVPEGVNLTLCSAIKELYYPEWGMV